MNDQKTPSSQMQQVSLSWFNHLSSHVLLVFPLVVLTIVVGYFAHKIFHTGPTLGGGLGIEIIVFPFYALGLNVLVLAVLSGFKKISTRKVFLLALGIDTLALVAMSIAGWL